MKAILLDGSHQDDNTGPRVRAALTAQLEAQGWEVEHVALRESTIGNCGGEFYCWIKHPGMCMFDDDNRTIAAAIVASDLAVYLTPVTFGGYSSVLKRMVDHQIQNILPFFAKIEGETHHYKRYKKNPDLLAVGWMNALDARSEAVFRHLSWRNAINWHAETCVSDVVLANQSDGALQAAAQGWLDDLRDRRSSPRAELPASSPSSEGTSEIRRALLLVGSPRTRKSASNVLGGVLFEGLSARSIETETIYVHPTLRSPERTQALLEAVDAADLIALSFPLYVDSLPAPAIEALERIAARAQARATAHRPTFAAIANSGFPEARHSAPALANCEMFCQEAGFTWAGGLALGSGGVVSSMAPAVESGKSVPWRDALGLAAEALAQGQAIPAAAQEVLGKPMIPHWFYRLMGNMGWYPAARHHRAAKLLKRRPYLA
jgi:multimeric flavodoxin WrbA